MPSSRSTWQRFQRRWTISWVFMDWAESLLVLGKEFNQPVVDSPCMPGSSDSLEILPVQIRNEMLRRRRNVWRWGGGFLALGAITMAIQDSHFTAAVILIVPMLLMAVATMHNGLIYGGTECPRCRERIFCKYATPWMPDHCQNCGLPCRSKVVV